MMQRGDCRVTSMVCTQAVQTFVLDSAAFVRPVVINTVPPERVIEAHQQVRCPAHCLGSRGFMGAAQHSLRLPDSRPYCFHLS